MKLWGGRFSKTTADLVEDFHSSISFDQRLYKYDILGSKAHAKMLGSVGIITEEEAQQIIQGLDEILNDIEAGRIEFSIHAEDIHMNVETLLTAKIGDVGKKLHTARSRNDQVALDTRLFVKAEIIKLQSQLKELLELLLNLAAEHKNSIMPGYTHLQLAQPITLGHHLMAYFQMFYRDYKRLTDALKRVDISPLGSGALAGTTFPIDRLMVAQELGLSGITENSLDAVSDRDYIIELMGASSLIMMHLSRFCEEIILWSTQEFKFIELDDAYSTGSSIMPQKKNPDVAELIRGKSGRVYGDLVGMLTMMKGLPLAYNKDMQEDKEALFDCIDTVAKCLLTFTPMLKTARFNQERMKDAAAKGFSNATDLADYLVRKGIPFREAHEIVGKLVNYCIQKNKSLEELSLEELKQQNSLIENDVYEALDISNCVARRQVPGGPAPDAVQKAIEKGWEII